MESTWTFKRLNPRTKWIRILSILQVHFWIKILFLVYLTMYYVYDAMSFKILNYKALAITLDLQYLIQTIKLINLKELNPTEGGRSSGAIRTLAESIYTRPQQITVFVKITRKQFVNTTRKWSYIKNKNSYTISFWPKAIACRKQWAQNDDFCIPFLKRSLKDETPCKDSGGAESKSGSINLQKFSSWFSYL